MVQGGPDTLVSAGEGVRAASLLKPPLPGMETFPGAGGIAEGSGARPAPSSPSQAAPGSRVPLWEPRAGAGAGSGRRCIAPQDAPSDATLCCAWLGAEALPWPPAPAPSSSRGAGPQKSWSTDSPSAAVAWDPMLGCASRGRGFARGSPGCQLGSHPGPPWRESSEKGFRVLVLSLCDHGGGWTETAGGLGGLGGVTKARWLCCAASLHRAQPGALSGHPSVGGDSLCCSIPGTSWAPETPGTPLLPVSVSSLTSPH